MSSFVIDTNVAVVANGRKTHASLNCQLKCVEWLEKIINNHCIVIDDNGLVLDEYHRNLNFAGTPNIGDFFYRYVFLNQGCPKLVEKVSLTPVDSYGNFQEFPNDPELEKFDLNDRKFVAIALTSRKQTTILNAVDKDWVDFEEPLKRNGLMVKQLCPEEVTN